jgi:hypothetical protein
MNLSSVPDRTPAEIRLLVEEAVRKIGDSTIVEGLRTFLVPPREEMRTWDWQKPRAEYPVWVVAESSQYDYGIVFSAYGFAPERPWGLVFSSHANFDADYCWYPSLEETYKESRLIEEFQERQQKGYLACLGIDNGDRMLRVRE